jgi:hypothetical protein
MAHALLASLAALWMWDGPAAGTAAAALPEVSEQVVRYEIDAWLDHPNRSVQGRERLTWRNTSEDLILELQLHLYMNAFKNERTTFMKESRGSHRGHKFRDGEWGYIDLLSLKLADGTDLLGAATFIQPDDGNEDDETVLRVLLPEPVEPGEEVSLEAVFSTRLPRVFARTGFAHDFYLVGQWFPKVCVYEAEGIRGRELGGWNCHQFHSNSEFYADFGAYDVKITVPSSFVVGATGKLAEPPRRSVGGNTTYRYVQEDVHDFAWTADPDFIKTVRTFSYAEQRDPDEERRMARVLGLDGSRIPATGAADLSGVPGEIRLSDVEVTLLLHPEHGSQIDRHFEAAFNAILYYGYWYGRYPYETLTVVDPAHGGRGAGGMEYPTFITAGSRYLAPSWSHVPEGVTIHEFGHQFWYGLVATNEFEESWLDEGLTTYSTGRILDKVYGPRFNLERVAGVPLKLYPFFDIPMDPDPNSSSSAPGKPSLFPDRILFFRWAGASNDALLNVFRDLPFLTQPSDVPIPFFRNRRQRYMEGGAESDQILRNSWEFIDRDSYGLNSYSKVAVMLDTLRAILGPDTFDRGMRLYHQRFRFRHPSTDDFAAAMSEAAGRDLTWYFDQTVRDSGLLDYELAGSASAKIPEPAGVFGPPADRRTVSKEEARRAEPGEEFETEVTVRRIGEIRMPVEIQLQYEGGRSETYDWDGEYRWHRIKETGPDRLLMARVGPAGGFNLESNLANNARTTRANRWPALKWWIRMVGWIQNVLHFYSGIS